MRLRARGVPTRRSSARPRPRATAQDPQPAAARACRPGDRASPRPRDPPRDHALSSSRRLLPAHAPQRHPRQHPRPGAPGRAVLCGRGGEPAARRPNRTDRDTGSRRLAGAPRPALVPGEAARFERKPDGPLRAVMRTPGHATYKAQPAPAGEPGRPRTATHHSQDAGHLRRDTGPSPRSPKTPTPVARATGHSVRHSGERYHGHGRTDPSHRHPEQRQHLRPVCHRSRPLPGAGHRAGAGQAASGRDRLRARPGQRPPPRRAGWAARSAVQRLGDSAEVGRGSQGAPKGRGAVSMCGSAAAVSICGSAARAIGHDGVAADRRQLSALPAERLGGRRR